MQNKPRREIVRRGLCFTTVLVAPGVVRSEEILDASRSRYVLEAAIRRLSTSLGSCRAVGARRSRGRRPAGRLEDVEASPRRGSRSRRRRSLSLPSPRRVGRWRVAEERVMPFRREQLFPRAVRLSAPAPPLIRETSESRGRQTRSRAARMRTLRMSASRTMTPIDGLHGRRALRSRDLDDVGNCVALHQHAAERRPGYGPTANSVRPSGLDELIACDCSRAFSPVAAAPRARGAARWGRANGDCLRGDIDWASPVQIAPREWGAFWALWGGGARKRSNGAPCWEGGGFGAVRGAEWRRGAWRRGLYRGVAPQRIRNEAPAVGSRRAPGRIWRANSATQHARLGLKVPEESSVVHEIPASSTKGKVVGMSSRSCRSLQRLSRPRRRPRRPPVAVQPAAAVDVSSSSPPSRAMPLRR